MRKAILMMLLAVVSSSAAAEWVKVAADETTSFYADPSTIRKKGSMVKMWVLFDRKTAEVFSVGKPYMSSKAHLEYDCKEEQSRILYSISHSENMGWGEVINSSNTPAEWRPVPPGSNGQVMWEFACRKR